MHIFDVAVLVITLLQQLTREYAGLSPLRTSAPMTTHMVERESLSILVVDDSEFFANLVAETLSEEHGMATTAVTDPREAVSLAADGTVDCLVSDYQMPDLTGLELYDAIVDKTDVPFILVTSEGDETVASRAIRKGVDEYILNQDINEADALELLANRIDNVVDRHRTQQTYDRLVANAPTRSVRSAWMGRSWPPTRRWHGRSTPPPTSLLASSCRRSSRKMLPTIV